MQIGHHFFIAAAFIEFVDVINFQFIYLFPLSVKLKKDERIHRSQQRMMERQIVKVCIKYTNLFDIYIFVNKPYVRN